MCGSFEWKASRHFSHDRGAAGCSIREGRRTVFSVCRSLFKYSL